MYNKNYSRLSSEKIIGTYNYKRKHNDFKSEDIKTFGFFESFFFSFHRRSDRDRFNSGLESLPGTEII